MPFDLHGSNGNVHTHFKAKKIKIKNLGTTNVQSWVLIRNQLNKRQLKTMTDIRANYARSMGKGTYNAVGTGIRN